MGNRFILTDKGIYDNWTEYDYNYSNKQDWEQLCGLLNQIHNTLEKCVECNQSNISK